MYDNETNRSVTSALFFAKNTNAMEQFFKILYNNQYHAVTNHALIILPSIYVLTFENFHNSKRKKAYYYFFSFYCFFSFSSWSIILFTIYKIDWFNGRIHLE